VENKCSFERSQAAAPPQGVKFNLRHLKCIPTFAYIWLKFDKFKLVFCVLCFVLFSYKEINKTK